jgi:hypothetical protein
MFAILKSDMGIDLQLRNGKSVAFVFCGSCGPLPMLSAWGHLGSARVEWGRNRGEGVGVARKLGIAHPRRNSGS